ncbi:MAG: hypothetical protein WA690_25260 [Candidatus Acidiferrales bacterium]
MRSLLFCLGALLLLPNPTFPQHAKPPGIVTGDTMANQPLEPPLETRNHQINMDQVNAETQELRRLADGLPPQIDQVGKGQLPKDLAENLKKIEKLAKHIRGEITP